MNSFEVGFVPSRKMDAGAAVVIYGLDPIEGQLDRTIAALVEDNNVFTYTYGGEIVRAGNPFALPEMISAIGVDIRDKTDGVNPDRVRMAGASLGAFVAYNIQEQLGLQTPGLYATAGVNLAKNVMFNPIFRPARNAFVNNGVGLAQLSAAWEDVDIFGDRPATVPSVCAISRTDPVVPYFFASRNLRAWEDAGAPVKVLPNWATRFESTWLHTAAINYFDSNIREIIEISKSLK